MCKGVAISAFGFAIMIAGPQPLHSLDAVPLWRNLVVWCIGALWLCVGACSITRRLENMT